MHYDAAAIGDDDLQYGGAWLARIANENNSRLFRRTANMLTACRLLPATFLSKKAP